MDTPMVEKSKLDEDKEGKAVDPSHYRGMIGTLLYLIASRPDLQFAICMCARSVDADHAGCQDTRRSTSGTDNAEFYVRDSGNNWQMKLMNSGGTYSHILIMNTTKEQQKELDDALVAPEHHLKIGKSNLRLSSNLKSKEPTLQVNLGNCHQTSLVTSFQVGWQSHQVNANNFRDMLKICPKLPGQKFEEPPLKEDILSFIRDLGHTGEIKFLSDVNVNHMHQPWRSFAAIINKCLSGKTTALESLRLLRASQFFPGMLSHKQVDYVYLLWEDLVFQVENKNSKKNNDMYYPRFTKVIVDYFMAKDQAIPRRNKMFWHYARDDFMFTTIRVISKHKDTQKCGYGEKAPKSKATKKKTDSESSPKTKPSQASKAITMKLATKRSLKEFHISHASGSGDGVDILSKVPEQQVPDEQQHTVSGTNKGAGDKPEVPNVPKYRSKSEEESWTFSQGEDEEENDEHDSANDNDNEDDDQENDSGETESDDDEDNFVHPNLSTYKADDQEKEKEEEKANDDDEVSSDQMVSTPPNYEISDEEENQKDDDNVMGGEQEDEEDEELYGDLNLNLDRRDAEMTKAQTNQETEEVHVSLTTEPPVVQQQSSSVSLDLVSKFINPSPDTALSSISGIVDNYLASQMKDAVNVAVQLKSNKLREDAQAENNEFLKQIDLNIKAIIKDQVKAQVSKIMPKVEKYVTESLGAEVLARSSNQPQTSYAAAASLSEFELKKILIDKIEENKSMNRSDIQKNLYNTLIESYNSDKDLFASYGDVVTLKRGRDDQDKDEEPSAGSNRGTKRRRSGKEESSKEATQKESKSTSSSKGASRSQPKSSGKSAQAKEHGPRVDDSDGVLVKEKMEQTRQAERSGYD
ncbi:hypothetical protein Tco_0513483 [Tanacetum coccineum]